MGSLSIAICVLSASLLLPRAARAQSDTADYTYGQCSRIGEEEVRTEIEETALAVLAARNGGLSIAQLVERQWVELNVDAVIDQEVRRQVNQVASEEGYFSRLWSGWSADKAEEFATRIADDAFDSPAFHRKLEELSTAVAGEIADEIEAGFAEAASAAFLCLKAYIGAHYSETLFAAFAERVSFQVEEATVNGDLPAADVAITEIHGKLLGGVGIIIVTEISRRIAQKLSERIAGRVAGRIVGRVLGRAGSALIPVAGWVIGLGLIAWDLWEGGKGALPQIEAALTSEEVKARIRTEIIDSIQNSLPDETALAALEIAVTVLEEWEDFCARFPDVCTLAQENATFRAILDETPLDQLDHLALLVDVLASYAGRVELENSLASGQFETALGLPQASYALIQTSHSLAPLSAWAELAGDRLDVLLAKGIHRSKTAADFSPKSLAAVLAVEDPAALDKLLALDRAELEALVQFAGPSLPSLAANTSLDELRQLISYLTTPPAVARATPVEELAPLLASGELTVQELVEPTPTTTPTSPAPIPVASAPVVVEQPANSNSIALVASGLVVMLLAAFGFVWWRQRKTTESKST
jgi:hypothetical protein